MTVSAAEWAASLYSLAKSAMPEWYAQDERANEFMGAAADIMGDAQFTAADWLGEQTRILQAAGATATTPDWLGQHARDRDTSRQLDEVDEGLQERLRNVPDALTPGALLDAATAILTASGTPGTPVLLELPRDEAYAGEFVADTGTGGTFVDATGDAMDFEPTDGFGGVPFGIPGVARDLVLSGADDGDNDGTFPIGAIVGDGAEYDNASGAAGADTGVTWTVAKKDPVYTTIVMDGHPMAYVDRGYRAGSLLPVIIMILPYGTTEATQNAVLEMLRQKKAAGVIRRVERRSIP